MQLTVLLLIATLAVAHASVTVKRSSNDGPHPTAMEIEVQLPNNKQVRIPLSRTDAFEDVPMTVTENGVSRTFSSRQLHDENFSHYRDIESKSVLSVRNVKGKRQFTGHVMHEGSLYSLEPMRDSEHRVTRNFRNPEVMEKQIDATKWKIQSHKKRQTVTASTTNIVELHLLIDSTAYHLFETIYGSSSALAELYYYYTHILNGIDTAYRNIGTPSISVSCIGITISKTASDDAWVPAGTNKDMNILSRMNTYISGKTADHYMAFTRIDLVGSNGDRGVAGRSYIGGVCRDKWKVSIIEDQGLNSWGIAAHELGHNMGAWHDGVRNKCNPSAMNIMSPVKSASIPSILSRVGNSFKFSSCSINYMSQYINSLGSSSCLRSSQGSRIRNLTSNIREGARITLDQVCRLTYPSSPGKFHIGSSSSNPAIVCARIVCRLSSRRLSVSAGLRAPVGTPCGNKKSCNEKGQCTADASAPAADESCFWGDPWPAKLCRNLKRDVKNGRSPCIKSHKKGCCKTLARVCAN